MRLPLRYLLYRMSRLASPDRQFVRSWNQALIKAGYLPSPRFSFLSIGKTATACLGVMLSLVGGTVVYAYNSDQVLPDHPLYPVRSTIESVHLKMVRSSEEVERVRLQHVRRRMREARLLTVHEQPFPSSYTKVLLEELRSVASVSSTAGAQDQPHALMREILKIEREELAEILEQQKEVQGLGYRKELNQLLREQVEEMDQHLDSLEKRTRRIKLLKAKLNGFEEGDDADE